MSVEVEEIAPVEMSSPIIEDALKRYSNQMRRGFLVDREWFIVALFNWEPPNLAESAPE